MHAYVLDEGAVPLIPAQIAEARRINVERPAHIKTELNPWTGRRDYAEFPRGCAADQYLERCARAALAARSDEPAA